MLSDGVQLVMYLLDRNLDALSETGMSPKHENPTAGDVAMFQQLCLSPTMQDVVLGVYSTTQYVVHALLYVALLLCEACADLVGVGHWQWWITLNSMYVAPASTSESRVCLVASITP